MTYFKISLPTYNWDIATQKGGHGIRVHCLRQVAGQPHQDGLDPGDLVQLSLLLQLADKCLGRLHGPHGVGGGGADTDLEDIKQAEHMTSRGTEMARKDPTSLIILQAPVFIELWAVFI